MDDYFLADRTYSNYIEYSKQALISHVENNYKYNPNNFFIKEQLVSA